MTDSASKRNLSAATVWKRDSWRQRTQLQQPEYADADALEQVLVALRSCPPLVSPGEVNRLHSALAEAAEGSRFILQAGDCAERFVDCTAEHITNQLKILLQMSAILTYGLRRPVVRIGRIAGQYAKPRSRPTEKIDGVEIPSYRGDSVNSYEPEPAARQPDPNRLLQSHHFATMTINYIRAMIDGGFADLHDPYNWKLHEIEQSTSWPEYEAIADRILDAINFMEAFGGVRPERLDRVDFFTSHEGLLLGYEEALTRRDPRSGRDYNLGAHMLWIGERTRALDGAHVEYFRGIANPIGVKIGPGCDPEELVDLLAVLNPDNTPGRITLITRMGVERVEQALPPLIRAARKSGRNATWTCDPMHGNLIYGKGRRKTRDFSSILSEFQTSFKLHRDHGSLLAGAHFELTGKNVTECIGGAVDVTGDDLDANYETTCDPRLNYAQSLEIAFLITALFQNGPRGLRPAGAPADGA